MLKLEESTNGTHIYMRMITESGRIEEIDAYITEVGWKYHTSADNNPDYTKPEIRAEIIRAFEALY